MRHAAIRLALLAAGIPLAAALLGPPSAAAQAQPASAAEELTRYVSAPDPSYSWREAASGRAGRTEFVEAILTSQTWHGITWKHQLFIIKPARLDASARTALLYVDGGSWHASFESGIGRKLPRQASVFVRAAEQMHTPVIVVRQVPFEPLFGLTEDALVAYTFQKYFETGEQDWPLLLPMVKSAVRAMDAAHAIAQQQWGLDIDRYMVTGSSKRGWTSWLTAAEDPRVMSVAPMVIDMLDIPAQIGVQRKTFGGQLSPEIKEFEAIHLPERIDTAAGRALVSIVDPYSYRDRLTMPKLILLGANDPYWPVDALQVYWRGLPQEKRVLYLPNQSHGLNDVHRLIGSLAALYRYSATGRALPEVSGTFTEGAGELDLTVHTDRAPDRLLAWAATSSSRDFHASRWRSHPCARQGQSYFCRQPLDRNGFTALYAEAVFKDPGEPRFSLSTLVCLIGGGSRNPPRAVEASGNDASASSDSESTLGRCGS